MQRRIKYMKGYEETSGEKLTNFNF